MIRAADALLTTQGIQPQKAETTVREFRNLFVETKKFYGPFAEFIEKWLTFDPAEIDEEGAHFVIEESTLFVEEAHGVYGRMQIQEAAKEKRPRAVREVAVAEPVAAKPEPVEEIADSLDLKGVECPYNYVRTKLRLEDMDVGQLLEITIDEGEPMRNVPASLKNDGHKILDTKKLGKHYRLLIRKGACERKAGGANVVGHTAETNGRETARGESRRGELAGLHADVHAMASGATGRLARHRGLSACPFGAGNPPHRENLPREHGQRGEPTRPAP